MFSGTAKRAALVGLALLVAALVLTACGSSGSSSSSESETSKGEESNDTPTTTSDQSSSGVAMAKKAIAPYIGQPTPFPVTEKLKGIPTGSTVAFVDCGTPICALYFELMVPAAQAMGLKLTRVKAGASASTVSSAFDSVVASEPDAVVVPGINPELFSKQLKELQEKNVPIITVGIVNAEEFGIEHPLGGKLGFEENGARVADYVTAEFGTDSTIAIYEVPELPFGKVFSAAFEERLEEVCPECATRTVQIPIATIGNTAPQQIVSDLQANPETTVAVFPADETETGLPAALQAAGLKVKTIGEAPTPTNLQYLKEGKATAALGVDVPTLAWTLVDEAARGIIGQPLTGAEAKGNAVVEQFLTGKDIGNPKMGWSGYPDFAERFAKLWSLEH